VGELEWWDVTATATGIVEVPDDVSVTLYISSDEPVSLEFMRGLPNDKIVELHIQEPVVAASFEAITHLAPGLRYLHLVGTDLGDEVLPSVANLRGLVGLYCLGNRFTRRGLRQLVVLQALELLCLEQENLSASDLEFAARLPRLTRLTGMQESEMDETELARLRAMLPWAEVV